MRRDAANASVVVKVGGSLFEMPDLVSRLECWLDQFRGLPLLLLPGGGRAADVVRDLDQRHALGDEAAHWLALKALTLNAHVLAALLARLNPQVVSHPDEWTRAWHSGLLPLVDGYAFARTDEGQPGSLPHTWDVTSDSLAARIAVVAGARQVILLKSVTIPDDITWTEAGRRGLVDRSFAQALAGGDPARPLEVRAINFRAWRP